MRYFALDLTASDAAELTGISVRSINDIYLRVRRLAEECARVSPFSGQLEADESCFGPVGFAANADVAHPVKPSCSVC